MAPSPSSGPLALVPPPFADGARPPAVDLMPRLLTSGDRAVDVVLLVDGLGYALLRDHYGHAPTLRAMRDRTEPVRTIAPATTAAALATIMLGAAPLEHGILGFTVHDPATGRAVPQLSGAPGVDPTAWQPLAGPAESSARSAVHVSKTQHAGSFLTRAAYRGWGFIGHDTPDERMDAVLAAVRRVRPSGVVFVHAADTDSAGHRFGTASEQWRAALEDVDALVRAMLRRLPRGTRLTITADHGMVDADPSLRTDLAAEPAIARSVRWAAGEGRALMLGCAGDSSREISARIEERWGDRVRVVPREEMLGSGLLGPIGDAPSARTAERLGDLLLLARGRATTTISTLLPEPRRPEIGVHGSLTRSESTVPMIRTTVGD